MTVVQPLRGRTVLVTRPLEQAGGLQQAISVRGGMPVVFPLIRIVPPADENAACAALASIASYRFVIFVSRNAVAKGLAMLREIGMFPPLPDTVRVLAVGAGTARDLVEQGVSAATVPGERYDSETLLALDELNASNLDRVRVLIVKGDGGRDLLRHSLCERGAEVDTVAAYARKPPHAGEAELTALWDEQPPDAVVLTSVEATENLFELARGRTGRLMHRLRGAGYAVVSDRVRTALESYLPDARVQVARGADDNALADALADLLV